MSNLPPKPDFDPHDRDKYPSDDRHYSRPYPPPSSRERSYRDHSDSYVPRPRPPTNGDSYVGTDSYVAPAYDRRHDDRARPYEGSHHPARQTWEHDSRPYSRDWREGYDRRDPPARHRDSDRRRRDDSTERRRDWETRRDYPPPRGPPRDYPRDYRRDRDYDHRSRDDDRHYRGESPSDKRRTSRSSISPSRRPADYDSRRRSPPPQRRSASPPPRHSRPPRSPPPFKNGETYRPPTPREKTALTNRSISTSPRPSERDRYVVKKSGDRRSPSPRPLSSRERRSRSPVWREKDQSKSRAELSDQEPSRSNARQRASRSPQRARSRSPSDIKPESQRDNLSNEHSKDKGKARAPADSSTDASLDTKPREPPSPPKMPRALTTVSSSSQLVEEPLPAHPTRFRKSPPTAPRSYGGRGHSGSNSPATSFQPALAGQSSKGEWIKRESAAGTPLQTTVCATEDDIPVSKHESAEPVIRLPLIPVYVPTTSAASTTDIEIKELQAHRVRMATEYAEISKAARRAVHELEMSSADLNAARMRREVADSQMEKARMGLLGMDYEGVFSD